MNERLIDFKDILDIDNPLELEDILGLESIENELSECELIELREEFELDNDNKNNIIAEQYTNNLINEINTNVLPSEQTMIDKFIDLCVRFIYLHVINEREYIRQLKILLDGGLNIYKYKNTFQLLETLDFLNFEKAHNIIEIANNLGKCTLSIQKKINCFKNKELLQTDFAKKILNKNFNEVCDYIEQALKYISSFKMIYDEKENIEENSFINHKLNLEIYRKEIKTELLNRLILIAEYFGINTLKYIDVEILSYETVQNYSLDNLNDYYIVTVKIIKKFLLNIKNKLECFIELNLRLDKLYSNM